MTYKFSTYEQAWNWIWLIRSKRPGRKLSVHEVLFVFSAKEQS